MPKKIIQKLFAGKDLHEKEGQELFYAILSGETGDAEIGAVMAAMSVKGVTADELLGAARAMRSKSHRIQPQSRPLLDTCGTGGDGSGTFNISTATAFVVAGCGVAVAKHGNRSSSSYCGSADVLEELGAHLELLPEIVEQCIDEVGLGFMFAPKFHGAMRYAAPARKQLGIRSIFNMLGPLTNPASAGFQLLGVYEAHLTELFAEVLHKLGCRGAMVVHGHDRLDEISVRAPTRITELKDGEQRTYEIYPETYFPQLDASQSLAGGDTVEENAAVLTAVLEGKETGLRRDVVLLNTAAALVVVKKAETLQEGIELARAALDTGAAREKLEQFIRFTQENKE